MNDHGKWSISYPIRLSVLSLVGFPLFDKVFIPSGFQWWITDIKHLPKKCVKILTPWKKLWIIKKKKHLETPGKNDSNIMIAV